MTTLHRLLVRDPLILMALVLAALVASAGWALTRSAWQEAEVRVEVDLGHVCRTMDMRFAEMERLAESVANAWEAGYLDLDDDQGCWARLSPWLRNHPYLSGVNLVREDGNGFGLGRVGEAWGGRSVRLQAGQWRFGAVLGEAARTPTEPVPAFDYRTRPWFQAGRTLEKPVWTGAYLFSGRRAGQPGISLVRPVRDVSGRFLGVLSLDLLLESLTRVVWEVHPTPGAWLMVLDEQGRVVAPPRTRTMDRDLDRREAFLQPVGPTLFPLAHDLYRGLKARQGDGQGIRAVRGDLHGRIRTLARTGGPTWHLVLALPESDIQAEPRRKALLLGAIGLALVALFASLALYLARRVAHPLALLARGAEALARGEPPPKLRTRIREIGILGSTLRSAHRGLVEREALQAQLRHSQRMQAVGTLAGGIAHDLNNQLAAILTQLELGLGKLESTQPALANLQRALEATRRCSGTTQALLAFSRPSKPELRPLDLNLLAESTLGLLAQLLGPEIRVEMDLHPGPTVVLGDWTQLEQLLVNLVLNARDALPAGGTIQVWTAPEGDDLLLKVIDNGTGMTPDVLEQVFDPFFTTKEVGKGTGLGLSTALGVAQAHGGGLSAHSEWGKGSVFTLRLPRAEVSLPRPEAEVPQPPTDLRGLDILLADDEEALRAAVAEVLEDAGARVRMASDGEEAWELWREGSSDLVVTDQLMPRCTGTELIERLRSAGSRVPVLILSGRGLEGLEEDLARDPDVAHLAKPFTIAHLLGSLAALRGRGAPSP